MSRKLVTGMLVALVLVAAVVALSSVVSAQEPQPPQGTCPMIEDGTEFPEGCPRYSQQGQEGICPMGGTCEGGYEGCEALAGSGDYEGCAGMGRHMRVEGGCPMSNWGD